MTPPPVRLNEAIVLCGGLGTRLRPVVSDVPKPMAPISGRPFLEYLLAFLAAEGVSRVIMAAGYKHQVIADHFGARWNGLDIAYSIEPEPLGTGGGLRLAMGRLEAAAGLVVNGDSLLITPLAPLARAIADGAALAMAACWRADAAGCGVYELDGGRLSGFHQGAPGEAGLVNAGVYAVTRDLFAGAPLPAAFSFEQDFLAPFAGRIEARVVTVEGGFIDIGLPETYAAAQTLLPGAAGGGPIG
jgi:D-glycero-alpha-D-manno-heptose 1-phosphate guanylyltransferase